MCITSQNTSFIALFHIILSTPYIISKEVNFSLWTPCRNGVTAPLILNLGSRWKWVVRFKPESHCHRADSQLTEQKAAWPSEPFRAVWREEKSLGTVWNWKKIPQFSSSGLVPTPTQPPKLCRWETKRTKVFQTDKYRIQITNTMAVRGRLAGAV
jgi:hypothetical protein